MTPEKAVLLPKHRSLDLLSLRPLLYALLLGAGLLLFLNGISHEALWLDESYTAAMAQHSPRMIIGYTIGDYHPPLYYLLVHFCVAVLGPSVFALRLTSLLAALALAALGAGPLRRACGDKVGLAFTFLVIITPGALFMAQEARMYTLAAFFVTAGAAYAYLAASGDKKSDWIKLGVFTLAAAYTHDYALLAVAAIQLLLCGWLFARRRQQLRRYFSTAGLVGLAYLPWLIPLIRQAQHGVSSGWIALFSPEIVGQTIIYPFAYKFSFPDPPLTSLLLLFALLSLSGYGLFVAWTGRHAARWLLLLAGAAYFFVLTVAIVVSLALRPVLTPRYIFPALGLLLLPAAYGLARLPRRFSTPLACALLLLLALPALLHIERDYFNGPMPALAPYLNTRLAPADAFLHLDLQMLGVFTYYYPDQPQFLYNSTLAQNVARPFWGKNVAEGPVIDRFVAQHKRTWLVSCYGIPPCSFDAAWLASQGLRATDAAQIFSEPFARAKTSLVLVAPFAPTAGRGATTR